MGSSREDLVPEVIDKLCRCCRGIKSHPRRDRTNGTRDTSHRATQASGDVHSLIGQIDVGQSRASRADYTGVGSYFINLIGHLPTSARIKFRQPRRCDLIRSSEFSIQIQTASITDG